VELVHQPVDERDRGLRAVELGILGNPLDGMRRNERAAGLLKPWPANDRRAEEPIDWVAVLQLLGLARLRGRGVKRISQPLERELRQDDRLHAAVRFALCSDHRAAASLRFVAAPVRNAQAMNSLYVSGITASFAGVGAGIGPALRSAMVGIFRSSRS